MTDKAGISNRLTPEEEQRDRQEHPPQPAAPNTAGDAPGAVAGAFGAVPLPEDPGSADDGLDRIQDLQKERDVEDKVRSD